MQIKACQIEDSIPNPQRRFVAIGCIICDGNAVKAYYHIDPDVLELRDDGDPLWQLYKKYNLLYYEHIAEK